MTFVINAWIFTGFVAAFIAPLRSRGQFDQNDAAIAPHLSIAYQNSYQSKMILAEEMQTSPLAFSEYVISAWQILRSTQQT